MALTKQHGTGFVRLITVIDLGDKVITRHPNCLSYFS
jgi:hypothetical protein